MLRNRPSRHCLFFTIEQHAREEIKRDLMALQEVTVEESGRKLAIRTARSGTCGKVFQAVHAAVAKYIRNV
jgi:hypothetical protein